jgi:hypothetical protein
MESVQNISAALVTLFALCASFVAKPAAQDSTWKKQGGYHSINKIEIGVAGTLTVAHEDSKDKSSVAENVKTQPRARTMAVDTKTHKVYLPAAQFGPMPAATKETPRRRASMIPNTFVVLVYGR